MKKHVAGLFAMVFILAFGGVASAHVTVQPPQVTAGSYQVFTLRVPTEKDAATVQVKVEVPDGVEVSRFEPKPEWSYELEKNTDGKIISVTWKSTGKGIGSTEFGQFDFQGKVAADAKELVWKAHQTYADGSIVDWAGAADSDHPASVTKVAEASGANAGGNGADADGKTSRDPLTLSLAIAGLVLGLAGFVISLLRRGKRA
ncbi:YcnI family protein [Cohnella caldifontis]|uniref:YcnI family copper-binding membrane protein n=1 Tax=Cohnella caldifontis TaxID=3027471 RepID=UPI0023EC68BC|nr:YcnI family protein [Cohnella sp. YIM B05605]